MLFRFNAAPIWKAVLYIEAKIVFIRLNRHENESTKALLMMLQLLYDMYDKSIRVKGIGEVQSQN